MSDASALTTKVLATAKRNARRRPGLEPQLRPAEPYSHKMAATEKPRTPVAAGSGIGVARWAIAKEIGPAGRASGRVGWACGVAETGPHAARLQTPPRAGRSVTGEAWQPLACRIGTGDLLLQASRCGDGIAGCWPREDRREHRSSTQAGGRHRVRAHAGRAALARRAPRDSATRAETDKVDGVLTRFR